MRVKDHYQGIIRQIMSDHGVKPGYTSHKVPAHARFEKVVQHTDWFVNTGDSWPHYRYGRYLDMLGYLTVSDGQVSHVDIGCGAGVFSWTFLDWATEIGVGRDHVDLYGFDHSPAMIKLSGMVRDELSQSIANYPTLHYFDDLDALLGELDDNHCQGMNYIITFGHVLAQAYTHTRDDINDFARIIIRIRKLMDARSKCDLIAVDAKSAWIAFGEGWNSLLISLERANIRYEEHRVRIGSINYGNSAKHVSLYPT